MPASSPDPSVAAPPPAGRPSPKSAVVVALALLSLAGVLASCAPAADAGLGAPTFALVREGSGLVRFDLPGFGEGGAVFHLVVDVHNPNPLPIRLAAVDAEAFVATTPLALATVLGGIDLAPRGTSRHTLELVVPAERAADLVGVFVDAVAGRPLHYRLDGSVAIDVLGARHRFPRVTLVQGEVQQDLALRAPGVAIDADASGVRSVTFDRVVIDLALTVRNPNRFGMVVRAPDARLRLGDREVAAIALPPQRVAALSQERVVQQLIVNPIQLGAAIVTQLQQLAAGQPAAVEVAITGRWELEVPGLLSLRLDPGELVRGRLD